MPWSLGACCIESASIVGLPPGLFGGRFCCKIHGRRTCPPSAPSGGEWRKNQTPFILSPGSGIALRAQRRLHWNRRGAILQISAMPGKYRRRISARFRPAICTGPASCCSRRLGGTAMLALRDIGSDHDLKPLFPSPSGFAFGGLTLIGSWPLSIWPMPARLPDEPNVRLPAKDMAQVRAIVAAADMRANARQNALLLIGRNAAAAAGAVAKQLRGGLFRIDLSAMISTYIGETEDGGCVRQSSGRRVAFRRGRCLVRKTYRREGRARPVCGDHIFLQRIGNHRTGHPREQAGACPSDDPATAIRGVPFSARSDLMRSLPRRAVSLPLSHPAQHQPIEPAAKAAGIFRHFAVEDLRLLQQQHDRSSRRLAAPAIATPADDAC